MKSKVSKILQDAERKIRIATGTHVICSAIETNQFTPGTKYHTHYVEFEKACEKALLTPEIVRKKSNKPKQVEYRNIVVNTMHQKLGKEFKASIAAMIVGVSPDTIYRIIQGR